MPLALRAQSGSAIPLNGIVARVNDTVITFKEVLTAIASEVEFLERRYGDKPELFDQKARELRTTAVRELVERQLILNEFKTGGYNLPDSYIEDQIAKDIKNYGNRLTLTKTLQAQGLTFENYRQKVRERVILAAMKDHFIPRDPVISPHKMELYYNQHQDKYKLEDQVKLRMIVVTNRPGDTAYSPRTWPPKSSANLTKARPSARWPRFTPKARKAPKGAIGAWLNARCCAPIWRKWRLR